MSVALPSSGPAICEAISRFNRAMQSPQSGNGEVDTSAGSPVVQALQSAEDVNVGIVRIADTVFAALVHMQESGTPA